MMVTRDLREIDARTCQFRSACVRWVITPCTTNARGCRLHCAVIMAGGHGKRLWPQSRIQKPKQFLPLSGGKSMLQVTAQRFAKFIPPGNVCVSTLQDYVHLVKQQLPALAQSNLFIEPASRDTAPCIGLAAIRHLSAGRDPVMITAPVDARIDDDDEFAKCVMSAVEIAESCEHVVTIGVPPTHPDSGFGYIQVADINEMGCYDVKTFIEKPPHPVAQRLVASKTCFWNTGIFVWKASTILRLIGAYMPDLYAGLRGIEEAFARDGQDGQWMQQYVHLPKQSIDYGVIEKASDVYMVPASFGWRDMGSWSAFQTEDVDTDDDGNTVVGDQIRMDTHNCIIDAQEIPIITIGVDGLILVATRDAILVCHKDREQQIKDVHDLLLKQGMHHIL